MRISKHLLIYITLFFILVSCGNENKEAEQKPKEPIKDSVVAPVASTLYPAPLEQVKDSTGILEGDSVFSIGNKIFHLEYCTLSEFMKVEKQHKDTAEEDYLHRDASLVKRVGKSLFLTLKDSKKVELADKGDDTDELEHYIYQGRLKGISHYIVRVQYYEGGGYLVINENSGEMVHIIDPLVVSPSKKYAIAGNCDLVAGYTFNGIELYEIQNNNLVLVGKKELEGWGPKKLYWQNDSTLIGERNVFDGSSSGMESTERLKLILRGK